MHEDGVIKSIDRFKLNKIIFYILFFVAFITPIFFVPFKFVSPQFSTSLIFAFGVILSIVIYVVSSLFLRSIDIPLNSKGILFFMFVVPFFYVVSGFLNGFSRGEFFGYTFDINTIGFIFLGFLYIFLVSIFFRKRESIFYSYFAFLVSVIIVSLFVILRIFFGTEILSFGVFNSILDTTIGSWNNLGIFFGISLILSFLTYQMISVSNIFKTILLFVIFLSLFFLMLVNFDTLWVVFAVFSFFLTLYFVFGWGGYTNNNDKKIKIPLLLVFVFVVSVIFVFWGDYLGGFISSKTKITNIELRPSFSATVDIAKNTISSNSVSAIFGSGPNTFINQWLVWKPDDVISTIYWNLDFANGVGFIPTFAITTGLVGFFSWVLFLGFYLYVGFKSIFRRVNDEFLRYLLTSSFFVSLYLWVMNFYYVTSTVVFIMTLFFTGLFFSSVYISGIIKIENKPIFFRSKTGFFSHIILISIFVVSVGLGYGLFKNSKSLWYFQKSVESLNVENRVDLSEEYALKAIEIVPYDIYYRSLSEISLIKLRNLVSDDTKNIKTEDVQKKFSDILSEAINASISAKNADPSNYLNWVSLGRVYESVSSPDLKIKGAYSSAENFYTEALKRNPKNPAILVMLSRLSATQGDLEKARKYAFDAIKIKNNYLDAYFILSQIEVKSNNIKGAIDVVTTSSMIDPTNPAIFFQLGLLKYNIKDWNGSVQDFEKALSIIPEYANARYFLGLSYEALKQYDKAIEQFEQLKITNPENKEVVYILENIKSGKPVFENVSEEEPEKAKNLPVKEKTVE